MLRVQLAPVAAAALAALAPELREEVRRALASLPAAYGRPHIHSGLGIRQLRPGVFECRIGLHLRALFVRESDILAVRFIGDHNKIRAWLKNHR
jgi:hypothetical protein